jgi:phenylpropionate dioxygenase-like ring-hydroxylating dioxygenase large terminal subunit
MASELLRRSASHSVERAMRVTQHPVFRRFWYPTIALHELAAGPRAFTLIGEKLVLWLGPDGVPVAFVDRCPHRGVALSVDSRIVGGALRCGYHGWRWDASGACVEIPQQPGQHPGGHLKCVRKFACRARYGYAWVCLDDPLADIPELPHAEDPGYRQVFEFDEPWRVNMFRILENALDIAHVTYVHTSTFGSEDKPVFPKLEMIETPEVLGFRSSFAVVNPPDQQRNLGIAAAETFRRQRILSWIPGAFMIEITYPTGRVHAICGVATPIDDAHVQRIQFVFRSDTEADARAADVAAFDRRVQSEDRRLLETLDADFPLSPNAEAQMAMDRPGLLYRERLVKLILDHDPNAQLVRDELAAARPRGVANAA